MLKRLGFTGAHKVKPSGSYLSLVLSSVCCDIDATIEASYPGSGDTWFNLIENPADGAQQHDYDFTDLGFSFHGGGSSAYFETDGINIASLRNIETCATINNVRRTDIPGNAYWFCFAGRTGLSQIETTERLFGSNEVSGRPGCMMHGNLNGAVRWRWPDQGSHLMGNVIPAAETDFVAIFSTVMMEAEDVSHTGWVNQRTGTHRTAYFVSSEDRSITEAHANPGFFIGASVSSFGLPQFQLGAGFRIYHFSCGNELLDDEKAGRIIDHLNERHSRIYA